MKKLVVLTGAGISAESGIATFRDANGLWEGHDIMEVASPEGWKKNKELVLDFYNQRRRACLNAEPNAAHLILAELENDLEVTIVTQNVDDLHEKAGSTRIIHLHGELFKSQSTIDPRLVYPIEGTELNQGDTCERGSQLRPFIVWFGEAVPMMAAAISAAKEADFFAIVGTSLLVYPAAGLIDYVSEVVPLFIVDPKIPQIPAAPRLIKLEEAASTGVAKMADMLRSWLNE
ncbi:NAD-dependent protein deacetylase of SIR2 family [Lunatimonas lonarensis]|uniref:protein acetyllysine N-acetyltransferase n=1 Tax=Lunatimonas lonarensis TaxID=1232681 RepID=R7ZTW4_9BACT|nr:Sir2 family NAD-dependent protein deacetylase [Lunatimonas lonarensis]EON77483.1 NAD-dependent protein deacetylase of SIR2 family [Lunatimonas lonarensis]